MAAPASQRNAFLRCGDQLAVTPKLSRALISLGAGSPDVLFCCLYFTKLSSSLLCVISCS